MHIVDTKYVLCYSGINSSDKDMEKLFVYIEIVKEDDSSQVELSLY